MKWIDSTDLRNWASKRDCQENIPLLVRKLIRATSNSIQSIKFPSGENVLLGGWDGILEVTDATDYLPLGISLWEFGVGSDPKGKADDDYAKRTANPLGYDPSISTFVFVTPRLWQNGKNWVDEKMKEGIWSNIKVINAEDLEEWIDTAPTVGAWLSKHIGKFPNGGIQPSDDFWDEWSAGPKFNLVPEILLGGRAKQQEELIKQIKQPSIIYVQGISNEEALAFIISCFKNNPTIEEDFFSKSIIVNNTDAFRELVVTTKPLYLITRFDDNGIINRAVQKGHVVIVPLDADSSNTLSNKIILPQIDRSSFVSALVKTGMNKELAERYSKESVRNITILRRQLEFTNTLPDWSLPANVSDIIPALLVGRWDENFEKDKAIISQVACDSYENYSKKLILWLHRQDSPIAKIGSCWRLISPFDAWLYAAKNLTCSHFESLKKVTLEVLSEINPAFQLLPDQRYMAALYGKCKEYSDLIREGVVQSLILTSIFGDKLQFDLSIKSDLWVDRIVSDLLSSDNPLLWKSFGNVLPLIAEASPSAFLGSVEKHLKVDKSPITLLFDEDPGFLTARAYHTGLLWALEGLAWFPEFLSRSSLILAKLSAIDPGGNITNRPINSLTEIFKSWHYQTLASLEERQQVLYLISQKEPDIAWTLLIRLLPDPHGGVGHFTYKTRWRIFNFETEKPISYQEIYKTHSFIVDLLISIFDFSELKLSKLIEESENLTPNDRNKILSFVNANISKIHHIEHLAWHSIRKILHHHRSSPDADWTFPVAELSKFEQLYDILTPMDVIDKNIWMFNDHWPQFSEGYQHKEGSHDEHEKLILDRKIVGLKTVYEEHGLNKIIELRKRIKLKWIFGDTLGYIINNEKEIFTLCELLSSTEEDDLRFIQSFLFRKSLLKDIEWPFDLYTKLQKIGFSNLALGRFFIPLTQTQKLWDFIEKTNTEIIEEYWRKCSLHFFRNTPEEKEYCLKKLIKYKRFVSALKIASLNFEAIKSETIVLVLEKTGTEKADEQAQLEGYEICRLFEELDNRNDVDQDVLIRLEWLFLPVLASSDNRRKPNRLHDELSRNPVFFMDVLKLIYRPDNELTVEEQFQDITPEQIQSRAKHADSLLQSWKKIPGNNDSGEIDCGVLNSWVKDVRELASVCERKVPADIYIGKILAQYPTKEDELWPPEEISTLIESLNSDVINSNFSIAIYNKGSFTSRGPFDGGDIERKKAERFHLLAASHKNKHPVMAVIFDKLANNYEIDAKRIDERAELDKMEY